MLGEGARTQADADRYYEAYSQAIDQVAKHKDPNLAPEASSGVSVKLSALHPRYEAVNEARVMDELYPRLKSLCDRAAATNMHFCLDAEEADRLVISLKLLERLATEPSLKGWDGLGLAVQAYQKRSGRVIQELIKLARTSGMRLMIRLVKGAYWDSEIKHAQVSGFPNFPVFTNKQNTDLSYIANAKAMLAGAPAIYPQFATHNAHTYSAIELLAADAGVGNYEFQRLHGMGEALMPQMLATRFGSTLLLGRMRTSSPTSYGACLRMARIQASYTPFWIQMFPLNRLLKTQSRRLKSAQDAIPEFLRRRACLAPNAAIQPA